MSDILSVILFIFTLVVAYCAGWQSRGDWEHDKKVIKKIGFKKALSNTIFW